MTKKRAEEGTPEWMEDPKYTLPCRRQPPEISLRYFFHEDQKDPATRASYKEMAKEICKSCKYKMPCLEYAITYSIDDGIWGGMTMNERKAFNRRRLQIRNPSAA